MKENCAPLIRRALSFEVGALAIIAVIILAAVFSLAYRPLAPTISQAKILVIPGPTRSPNRAHTLTCAPIILG